VAQLRAGISLCMIVKNEEAFLPGCLASVRGVVDEINIVDTGSTDRTIEIARSYGATVISRPWRDNFASARNESLVLATRRWTLILDADEEITPGSVEFLRKLRHDEPGESALFVRIINSVEDESGGATFSHFLPRIFPTSPRIRYHGAIHELLKIDDAMLSGRLSGVEILHHGYMPDATQSREKANRNMTLLQRELAEKRTDPFSLFNFGFNAVQQHPQMLDDGIAALEAMVEHGTNEPFLTIGISALATAYARRKGNCERALQLVMAAEERLPPDADILFTHGTVLNMLGRFAEGREIWQRLLDSRDALRFRALVDDEIFKWKTPYNIALSLIADGRANEALSWLERALASKPDSTFILIRYANALEAAGASADAEAQFQRWAERDPVYGAIELIHFLCRGGRLAEAAACLAASTRIPPAEAAQAGIVLAKAMIESRTCRPEESLEAVLRLEPANAEALWTYERLMSERTEAIRAAELTGECRSAADFFRRSNRLLELERYAEAASAAARAVELDPGHCAAAYTRALATLNMGEETRAAMLFDLVPASDPKIFASAMSARAHILEQRDDVDGLRATLARWIEAYERR
jgi:tetratricopeptide (TPR) repeat protein